MKRHHSGLFNRLNRGRIRLREREVIRKALGIKTADTARNGAQSSEEGSNIARILQEEKITRAQRRQLLLQKLQHTDLLRAPLSPNKTERSAHFACFSSKKKD